MHHWCNLTSDQVPPPTSPFASDSPLAYCLTAQVDHQEGEELFIDYGVDCNSEVLATYGFVALDGHHDCTNFHLAHAAAKLCWEKVKAIKAFDLLKDVRLFSAMVPPASVGDFFHLAALPSCEATEIEKFLVNSSNVTKKQDQEARRQWMRSLHSVKSQLKRQVKRGPWDTRTRDGLVQQLRQSELRALDWHIRFAEGSKTLSDQGAAPSEQWYERCFDQDPKCQEWALEGECDRNGAWMGQTCCKACKEEDRKASKCLENLRAANRKPQSEDRQAACTDSDKYKAKCALFAKVGGCNGKQKAFMAKFCCATCAAANSNESYKLNVN